MIQVIDGSVRSKFRRLGTTPDTILRSSDQSIASANTDEGVVNWGGNWYVGDLVLLSQLTNLAFRAGFPFVQAGE